MKNVAFHNICSFDFFTDWSIASYQEISSRAQLRQVGHPFTVQLQAKCDASWCHTKSL